MTVSDFVERMERHAPALPFMIESVIKKARGMGDLDVFLVVRLYMPGKLVEFIEPTPSAAWARCRVELDIEEPVRKRLERIDVHRLARRERA